MRITTGAAGAVLLVLMLTCIPALARIPEPPFTLHGTVTVDGQPAEAGWVRCVAVSGGETLDLSPLGPTYGLGSNYVLRLPMDSVYPQASGAVRAGQEVFVYVGDLPAARVVVGQKGTHALLNLEVRSIHEITVSSGPEGNPNPAPSEALVEVSVQAEDSIGHPLAYIWEASCPGLPSTGVFGDAESPATSWEAPRNATGSRVDCNLTVTMDDGLGLLESRSYAQGVDSIPDSVNLTAGPSGSPNPIASGGAAALSATAVDSLGHPLTYTWSASCPGFASNGSFVNNGSATPTWLAPVNRADDNRECTITVEAGHAGGPKAQGFYQHAVEPVTHSLSLSAIGGTPNPARSGSQVALQVTVEDSRDHLPGYSWVASCPAASSNGSFNDPSSATPLWTAPDVPVTEVRACTVGVTVDDAHGMTRIATYQQTVFGGAPVALFEADPSPVICPGEVLLDASASYHENPSASIVSWEWDFHHDGADFTPEASGVETSIAWGEVGPHTVALRVTDDSTPPVSAVTAAEVVVDGVPPVADAGGPYLIDAGDPLPLNASASSDPDFPCGDRLASVAWDLDGDGTFGDVTGGMVRLPWPDVETMVCGGACEEGLVYPVAVRVTDTLGYEADAAAVVWIGPLEKAVKLTAPNGGEMLGNGSTQSLRWVSQKGLEEVKLLLSLDGGAAWREIVPSADAAAGLVDWTLPARLVRTQRDCRMRIEGFAGGMAQGRDLSDGPFAIGPLDVTFPERGDVLAGGDTVTVSWNSYVTKREAVSARVRYTLDGGRTWLLAGKIDLDRGTFSWKVPPVRTRKERCRVGVTLLDGAGRPVADDVGEGTFTILGLVDVTGPEKGVAVYGGTNRAVTWTTRPGLEVARVRVQFTTAARKRWRTVGVLDGNPGVLHWNVPGTSSGIRGCRLRVVLLDERGNVLARDAGEGFFRIVPWP